MPNDAPIKMLLAEPEKTQKAHQDSLIHSLTVVLPAYNERENIQVLVQELFEADSNHWIKRIIYVDDDSPDGSSEFIKTGVFPIQVLCLHRIGRQGLSSAVTEGILLADTPYVAVMDADGQHKPQDLIQMIEKLTSSHLDIVIGSRFKSQKKPTSHSGLRLRLSQLGNTLSQLLTKRKLTDPLTGFFVMKRQLFVEVAKKIKPAGFKILLELLYVLKDPQIGIEEIQIDFRARHSGESKFDLAVAIEFLEQILNRISSGIVPEKFLSFAIVGASGVIVHMSFLYLFFVLNGSAFLFSQTIAAFISMTWNYTLNNLLTFRRNQKRGLQHFKAFPLFVFSCSLGLFANVGIASVINHHNITWWLSGLTGIIIGTVFNFVISKALVWK